MDRRSAAAFPRPAWEAVLKHLAADVSFLYRPCDFLQDAAALEAALGQQSGTETALQLLQHIPVLHLTAASFVSDETTWETSFVQRSLGIRPLDHRERVPSAEARAAARRLYGSANAWRLAMLRKWAMPALPSSASKQHLLDSPWTAAVLQCLAERQARVTSDSQLLEPLQLPGQGAAANLWRFVEQFSGISIPDAAALAALVEQQLINSGCMETAAFRLASPLQRRMRLKRSVPANMAAQMELDAVQPDEDMWFRSGQLERHLGSAASLLSAELAQQVASYVTTGAPSLDQLQPQALAWWQAQLTSAGAGADMQELLAECAHLSLNITIYTGDMLSQVAAAGIQLLLAREPQNDLEADDSPESWGLRLVDAVASDGRRLSQLPVTWWEELWSGWNRRYYDWWQHDFEAIVAGEVPAVFQRWAALAAALQAQGLEMPEDSYACFGFVVRGVGDAAAATREVSRLKDS